jgi:hypothetical protein
LGAAFDSAVRELSAEKQCEGTRIAGCLRSNRLNFKSKGHFEVIGSDSGHRYRIYYGISTSIYEVHRDEKLGTRWCFVPISRLVAGDVMLAQKVALETNALSIVSKLPLVFASCGNCRR